MTPAHVIEEETKELGEKSLHYPPIKLGYMNSKRPSKLNLLNAFKPSKLLVPTKLRLILSSLASRVPE